MNVRVSREKLMRILEKEIVKLPKDAVMGEPEVDEVGYTKALKSFYNNVKSCLEDKLALIKTQTPEQLARSLSGSSSFYLNIGYPPNKTTFYKNPPNSQDRDLMHRKVNLRMLLEQQLNMLKLSDEKLISINDKSYEWKFLGQLKLDDHDIMDVEAVKKPVKKPRDKKQPEMTLKEMREEKQDAALLEAVSNIHTQLYGDKF